MPIRQRRETFERKPKRVHILKPGSGPTPLTTDPAQVKAILAMIAAIEGGAPLPSGYYRKGVGTTPDRMLEALGIMHLHLGRPSTSELLFAVQYPDDVVFLELSDHSHFATRPAGKRLQAAYGVALAAKEIELDALPKVTLPSWAMKVRKGPIPTKPRPAAAPEPAPAPAPAPPKDEGEPK